MLVNNYPPIRCPLRLASTISWPAKWPGGRLKTEPHEGYSRGCLSSRKWLRMIHLIFDLLVISWFEVKFSWDEPLHRFLEYWTTITKTHILASIVRISFIFSNLSRNQDMGNRKLGPRTAAGAVRGAGAVKSRFTIYFCCPEWEWGFKSSTSVFFEKEYEQTEDKLNDEYTYHPS